MENKWETAMLARKVDKIDKRVDTMETKLEETIVRVDALPEKTMQIAIGSADGFLPDHLEKTKRAVETLGQGTASYVAKITKRARAVESGYLCQLERIGLLTSERVGGKKWFRITTNPLLNANEPLELVLQTSQH